MGTMSQGLPGRGLPARGISRQSVGWSIAISVLLVIAGLVALLVPFLTGVLVEGIVAWLLLFGGVAHLVLAFHVRGAGAHIWEALVGLVYIVAGLFFFFHPLGGLIGLTILLGWYLLVKGIFEVIAGFQLRGVAGGGYLWLDAVLSLILAALIWLHLPYASDFAIGTLLGLAILFSGLSRLMLTLTARRTHAVIP